MRKLFFGAVFTLATVCTVSTNAQVSYELGCSLGASTYLGDLQPRAYTYSQPGATTGGFIRYNMNAYVAVRGFANYARLYGSDAKSLDAGMIRRNLSFRSDVVEFGGVMEWNVIPFDRTDPQGRKFGKRFKFAPYFFGGVNIFHFNPQALYKNEWVDLQPLQTEGQSYTRTNVAIPFGMGFKWHVSKHVILQWEFGFRKTFTDYLDDVSASYPDLNKLALSDPTAADLSFRGDELPENPQLLPAPGSPRGLSSNMDWYTVNNFSLVKKFKLRNRNW
jgi:hypothetical protein